jgi:hypothetical protein
MSTTGSQGPETRGHGVDNPTMMENGVGFSSGDKSINTHSMRESWKNHAGYKRPNLEHATRLHVCIRLQERQASLQ